MDPFEQTMHWLLAGSKGASNRIKMLHTLEKRAVNLNELSAKTGMNYKTAKHHIGLLLENGLVVKRGAGYGGVYFLSERLVEKRALFKKMSVDNNLQEKGK